MKLHKNGAVVDDDGKIIVRFVYADRELEEHLLKCLRQRGTGGAKEKPRSNE